MKAQADAKRWDVSYQVDEYVYVKLHPYRQTSLTHAKYHKLTKRYYGPFQILEKIGAVAYRLAFPSDSRIHNVFHCSLLKPHQGPVVLPANPLPPSAKDNHPLLQLLRILDNKWSTDTMWEQLDELRATFHLEDKVFLLVGGGGVDSSIFLWKNFHNTYLQTTFEISFECIS